MADQATLRNTPLGPVVGFTGDRGAHVWLGLPFAAPPVGDLRWKAPTPAASVDRPFDSALAIGNMCVQYPSLLSGAGQTQSTAPVGNEDCLYLNVWAPPFAPQRRSRRRQGAPGDALDPRRRQQHRPRRQLQRARTS